MTNTGRLGRDRAIIAICDLLHYHEAQADALAIYTSRSVQLAKFFE